MSNITDITLRKLSIICPALFVNLHCLERRSNKSNTFP
jgi:hypothetical protein